MINQINEMKKNAAHVIATEIMIVRLAFFSLSSSSLRYISNFFLAALNLAMATSYSSFFLSISCFSVDALSSIPLPL